MLQLAIQPVPNQIVSAVCGGQNCQLYFYSKSTGMFCDLNSNGVDISTCVICRNGIPLCPIAYTGFLGNFMFIDTQGDEDPLAEGLGSRWQLIYLEASEYALIQEMVQ